MGSGSSLNSLIKILQKLTNVTIDPDYTDARPGDIRHSYADVSKALKVLQFKSEVSVVDGLRSTIDWYRTLNGSYNLK